MNRKLCDGRYPDDNLLLSDESVAACLKLIFINAPLCPRFSRIMRKTNYNKFPRGIFGEKMRKKLFFFCAALSVLTSISSCAVRNPYISPTTGDAAKLRVINHSDGTAFLYASTSCQVGSAKVLAAFSKFLKSDLSRAGMYDSQPTDGNKDVVERVIEAGKEMQIFTSYQGASGLGSAQCFVEVAFNPKKDEQYEMTYIANSQICRIAIDRLSETDGKIVRTRMEDVRPLKKGECR